MRGGMAPALRMPALGSSMMSLPATLRLDLACTIMELKHHLTGPCDNAGLSCLCAA